MRATSAEFVAAQTNVSAFDTRWVSRPTLKVFRKNVETGLRVECSIAPSCSDTTDVIHQDAVES